MKDDRTLEELSRDLDYAFKELFDSIIDFVKVRLVKLHKNKTSKGERYNEKFKNGRN